jgi:hypothetical protein
MSWQRAYVAMGAALGEPLEDLLGSLDGAEQVGDLADVLASDDRAARGRALGAVLMAIAHDLEEMILA